MPWFDSTFDSAASTDLPAAVAQADVVSCATLATSPVVLGKWLKPGSHLDLIGSFSPAMRETDDDCFAGASVFVDTEEALRKSGDLLGPMARGVFAADSFALAPALQRRLAPDYLDRAELIGDATDFALPQRLLDLHAARGLGVHRRLEEAEVVAATALHQFQRALRGLHQRIRLLAVARACVAGGFPTTRRKARLNAASLA